MAVKFFRMSEKGSIKRPTISAIFAMVAMWSVSAFFLREHPFFFILLAWPAEYVLCAVLFSNPFRITLGKAMHLTREPVILAAPTQADRLWLAANMPIFERTGIRLYQGEPMKDVSKNETKN